MDLGQLSMSNQLEVVQRIFENGIGKGAVHPQRFAVRSHSDSVRRSSSASLSNAKTAGLIRQLDSCYFRALSEIHHCKAVKSRKLDENAARRSIGSCFECHGTDWAVELDLPYHFLRCQIDHGRGLVLDGTADCILAVGRDVHVMHAAVDGNALGSLLGGSVDHIHHARRRADTDQHTTSVFSDGNIVWASAERNFVQDVATFSINDVEDTLRLVADVKPRPVGRERNPMRQRDSVY